MARMWQSILVMAFLATGLFTVGTAQAGDVFKGSAKGPVMFVGDNGPESGFWTDKAAGQLTHLGKSTVALAMMPNQSDAGTVGSGLSGRALLTAANGDQIRMLVATADPEVVFSPDGTSATATYAGTYQMVGGTGRFHDAGLAGRLTITIRCDFRRKYWEIDIRW